MDVFAGRAVQLPHVPAAGQLQTGGQDGGPQRRGRPLEPPVAAGRQTEQHGHHPLRQEPRRQEQVDARLQHRHVRNARFSGFVYFIQQTHRWYRMDDILIKLFWNGENRESLDPVEGRNTEHSYALHTFVKAATCDLCKRLFKVGHTHTHTRLLFL